ncbi:MAG: hypothetical protein HQK79_10105 [Desulfobacterales bacterium]|nr:hypothetical protein [Desulfobacterales bacterium]
MKISDVLFWHLRSVLYLSSFEMIIRGLAELIGGEQFESNAKFAIQGWNTILPFVLIQILFVRSERKKYQGISKLIYHFLLIQISYLLGVVLPINYIYVDITSFFIGLKIYFLPFVYFFILYYLLKNRKGFEKELFEDVIKIGLIYGVFLLFETYSMYFNSNSLYLFFRSLAHNESLQYSYLYNLRPIGPSFNIHGSAVLFCIISIFMFYSKVPVVGIKPIFLFSFFVFCLLLTSSRTYTIILITYLILSIILLKQRDKKIIILFLGICFSFFMSETFIWKYLQHGIVNELLTKEETSKEGLINMRESIGLGSWIIKNSLLPNGLRTEKDLSMSEKLPYQIRDQEVFAYKLIYQLGIVGYILWLMTIYKGLLKKGIFQIFKSPYLGIMFAIFSGMIHYYQGTMLLIFILLIFCNLKINLNTSFDPDIYI